VVGERFQDWVSVGAAKVRLWCARAPNRSLWAGASFNPARVLSEDPLFLCSIGDLPIAFDHVWPQLTCRARPADPDWRNASVRRVDLARDFEVDDPARVLEALLHIPRKRAKQVYAHHDPVTTVITSITLRTSNTGRVGGNRTGQKVLIYNKGAQLDRPDLARLRWEARCQDWAKSVGKISYVHQLTGEAAIRLILDRWARSGAGKVMASGSTLVDVAISMGLSSTETRTLIGDAVMRGTGREMPVAKGTRLKRNARLRELDYVLSATNPYPFGSRLDFDLGIEVPIEDPTSGSTRSRALEAASAGGSHARRLG
jgi:hypothetical protein